MNFEEKVKICKNYVLFKEYILFGGKSSELLDYFCVLDVIIIDDYERILLEGILFEKVQCFLRVFEIKKNLGCFDKFCEVLDKSGYGFLVKVIREIEVDLFLIEKGINVLFFKLSILLYIVIRF